MPPIAVHAPMCVQTNFFGQRNGKKLIVHLLNEINTSAGRALPKGGHRHGRKLSLLVVFKSCFMINQVGKIRTRGYRPECIANRIEIDRHDP